VELPATSGVTSRATPTPANALPPETNGYVTLGCLNSFRKVIATVLDLWARVLGGRCRIPG
jgi:hypothetical protein